MAQFVNETAACFAGDNSAAFACPFMSFDGIIIIADTVLLAVSLFISLIALLAKQLFPSKAIQTFSSPLIA